MSHPFRAGTGVSGALSGSSRSFGRIGIGSVSSSFSGPVLVASLVAAIVGFLLLV
ncbi:MAG TPA: hypothetical protein VH600_01625 [Burkholderiales bacterium]|jgi:hypothetical protein